VTLKNDLVQFSDVCDLVDSMLSSDELNAPSLFCASAVELWAVLIGLKARHDPAKVYDTSERALRWLAVRLGSGALPLPNVISALLTS
jgi:hypothetical protein